MEVGASAGCPQWECVQLQPSRSREQGHDWGLAGGRGGTAQPSRDAQGAGPGSAAQHPALSQSSLSAQASLNPTTKMGQPLPSQGFSLSKAAHLKLKRPPK